MKNFNRDAAIKKITEMSKEQVSKVLIFMAGMEAEHGILENANKPFCESLEPYIDTNTFCK